MTEWIRMLRGALLFDTATYAGLARRPDAMLHGAIFLVIVALLAALPAFIIDFANGVQARPVEAAQASPEIAQVWDRMQPFVKNLPSDQQDAIRSSFDLGSQIATSIQALPIGLPRPLAGALRAIGGWLSKPFAGPLLPLAAASLATWLGYGVWVVVAGKLLGGRADLAAFFGTTALFAGPHLLGVFGIVPILGPTFGVIAFFWGLAVYVKATAVSQELTVGRSVLAVLLPAIVVAALALLFFFGLAGILISAISSAR